MNRPAAQIVRATAPSPQPTEGIEAFASGVLFDSLVRAIGEARVDWRGARSVMASAGRRASGMNSKRRRLHGDILHALVRHDRTLDLLIDRAGISPNSSRAVRDRARVFAGLVALYGLDPGLVDSPLDAEELADPTHLLLGWVLETDPSEADALGAGASLPTWIARKLLQTFGADAAAVAGALNRRADLAVRVLTGDVDAAARELDAERSPWSERALVLRGRADVRGTTAFQEGRVAVQDVGSQLIAELVGAEPGQVIIDACAGAGGKTLALAAAMEGRGRLLACDVRFEALQEAQKRLRQAGLGDSVEVCTLPDEGTPKKLRKTLADAVLIDAPCTGSGALRRRPQARWIAQAQDLFELPAVQLGLLERFAPRVKPGGRLVYATCSLFEDENRAVVDAFLASHPGFRLAPPHLDETLLDGGCLRTRPDLHGTDGFFAAVLRNEDA